MTKLFYILISLLLFTSISNLSNKTEHKDIEYVKNSILEWADSTFYHHEEYRFEQFHAEYSDMFQIALLRLEMYEGKQLNLEKIKRKGFYKKSDSEYAKEHAALVKKNKELRSTVANFENRANSYQILFWSNIKTNQGPTVYYSHLIKLNSKFKVISAEVKSEIGKKNDKTKILYSKDVKKRK